MNSSPENKANGAAERTFNLLDTLRVLAPETLEVRQTEADGLTLRCPECGEKTGVLLEPCFPVTQYGKYLAFRDENGEELGILEDMSQLPHESRLAVERELNDQHVLPTITKITAISRDFHIRIWEVETDRGPRRFAVRGRHEAHHMGPARVYVRDAEGNGYLVPDVARLDPASRELIDTNT